jgi:hypothetical protein
MTKPMLKWVYKVEPKILLTFEVHAQDRFKAIQKGEDALDGWMLRATRAQLNEKLELGMLNTDPAIYQTGRSTAIPKQTESK